MNQAEDLVVHALTTMDNDSYTDSQRLSALRALWQHDIGQAMARLGSSNEGLSVPTADPRNFEDHRAKSMAQLVDAQTDLMAQLRAVLQPEHDEGIVAAARRLVASASEDRAEAHRLLGVERDLRNQLVAEHKRCLDEIAAILKRSGGE